MSCGFVINTAINEASVKALSSANYRLYQANTMSKVYGAGMFLAVLGVFSTAFLGRTLSMVILFTGCVILANGEYPARQAAKAMLQSLNGKTPQVELSFLDDGIRIVFGKKKGSVSYSDLGRLAEDKEFLFLFLGEGNAYAIPKTALSREQIRDFKVFLEKKTRLAFEPVEGIGKKLLTYNPFKSVWRKK